MRRRKTFGARDFGVLLDIKAYCFHEVFMIILMRIFCKPWEEIYENARVVGFRLGAFDTFRRRWLVCLTCVLGKRPCLYFS